VRLTEKFIADPTAPFIAAQTDAIAAHVSELIKHAGFSFSLPATAPAIGTGGTVTSVRTIQAARTGRPLAETPTRLSVATLRSLLNELGSLPLAERQHIAGLPAARADVFPTALATVITLAELGRFDAFENSLYNLRWGLVAEALDPASA
jgi:exopolyphosphatase/guanosine-5'-triphosphate,3'-diphosphate pyrophosphatase